MSPEAQGRTQRGAVTGQLLVYVDSQDAAASSPELARLRTLGREGLIRLVDSAPPPPAVSGAAGDAAGIGEADVDRELYELVYDLLHPGHEGGIATVPGTERAMELAIAVRHGADIFVTSDPRLLQRDRPFDQRTDTRLLEAARALELVLQEIADAD